jgi:AraC-like DNA-binding protein
MPVGEVATLLGYANLSAYTRAFARWSGMGPAQWRAARGKRSTRGPRSGRGD